MSTRTFDFFEGEFYHVYNRGVEKRNIFLDQSDYKRFMELLYAANCREGVDFRSVLRRHNSIYEWERGDALVAIGAYCLMPNHFHILLTPLQEGGVSLFLQKVTTSYSMYFNRKYERTGTLFEGKFKATHADIDEYLKYLFAYIHLNPVKLLQPDWKVNGINDARAAYNYVSEYKYSSLPEYQARLRIEQCIVNKEPFPGYFATAAEHLSELLQWLTYEDSINLNK